MLLIPEPTSAEKKASRWELVFGNPWVASFIEVAFTLLVSNLAILIAVFVYLLGQPQEQESTFYSRRANNGTQTQSQNP